MLWLISIGLCGAVLVWRHPQFSAKSTPYMHHASLGWVPNLWSSDLSGHWQEAMYADMGHFDAADQMGWLGLAYPGLRSATLGKALLLGQPRAGTARRYATSATFNAVSGTGPLF